MMTVDLTQKEITRQVCEFLTVLGIPVYLMQENRVPLPKEGDFVFVNAIGRKRLDWTKDSYIDSAEEKSHMMTTATEVTYQIDFYGKNSGDNAQMFLSLMHDKEAWDIFTENGKVRPLDCSDPTQMPLINAETQYEERWKITARFQANVTTTRTIDFFDRGDIEAFSIAKVDTIPPIR